MSQPIITAIIGAAGVILGALFGFWVQARRLPSDIRLVEAQADKTQHESSSLVIKDLQIEVERLKAKVTDMEARLTKAEARATGAESRLADAEWRAEEHHRSVIHIGQRLDQERAKSRDMVVRLVGVIEYMLDCVEHPGRSKNIDRPGITKLISDILGGYPAEQLVKV